MAKKSGQMAIFEIKSGQEKTLKFVKKGLFWTVFGRFWGKNFTLVKFLRVFTVCWPNGHLFFLLYKENSIKYIIINRGTLPW